MGSVQYGSEEGGENSGAMDRDTRLLFLSRTISVVSLGWLRFFHVDSIDDKFLHLLFGNSWGDRRFPAKVFLGFGEELLVRPGQPFVLKDSVLLL